MNGYLNVRDLPASISPISAVGDGCKDDTLAIQAALCALARRWSDTCGGTATPVTGCFEPEAPYYLKWPTYAAGLYFPAGIYRITKLLEIPWLIDVRIFGDGGRGGQGHGGTDDLPCGSVIRQDNSDAPIFRFRDTDTAGVTIERLGFTWANRQEAPGTWQPGLPLHEPQPSTYTDPGAVAILFSAGARGAKSAGYYQNTIRDCRFERGWRGIAIDDTYTKMPPGSAAIAVWDTHIERCDFHAMRGAGVSLVNHPDHYIGMPSNALTDCFIENYSNPDGTTMTQEYNRRNVEPQVRLAAQTAMRIEGLDAEGSKTTVLYAADSQVTLRELYTEHIKIGYPLDDNGNPTGPNGAPYAQVLSLYGGEYVIEGLHLDGTLNAWDEPNQQKTFASVIFATDGASVVVSGVRARAVANLTMTTDLDVADGFHHEGGSLLALHTNGFNGAALARFRTTGEVHLDASSKSSDPFVLFDGSLDGNTTADAVAARVEREGRMVRVSLSFPQVPIGRARANNPFAFTSGGTFPGAMPGDLVVLGPPSSFPARCLATGVVTGLNTVEVRVFNGSDAAVTPPTGVWTVRYGSGANNVLHALGS